MNKKIFILSCFVFAFAFFAGILTYWFIQPVRIEKEYYDQTLTVDYDNILIDGRTVDAILREPSKEERRRLS